MRRWSEGMGCVGEEGNGGDDGEDGGRWRGRRHSVALDWLWVGAVEGSNDY